LPQVLDPGQDVLGVAADDTAYMELPAYKDRPVLPLAQTVYDVSRKREAGSPQPDPTQDTTEYAEVVRVDGSQVVVLVEAQLDLFQGRAMHALFLDLVGRADPPRATALHDEEGLKPFTTSSFYGRAPLLSASPSPPFDRRAARGYTDTG